MTTDVSTTTSRVPSQPAWYVPLWSPEHGVYVVLAVAFLTGAAAAQHWTWLTTFSFFCALFGLQAEHPWVLQIKQRKSLKPRLLVWGCLYSGLAGAIALYLYLQVPAPLPLLSIYGAALAAFGVDALAVFYRQQKSLLNEWVTFTAVCLVAPLAYVATTGSLSQTAIALWVLNSLFFTGTLFTLKLRKVHPALTLSFVIGRAMLYHAIAALLVVGLWHFGALSALTASAYSLALLKAGLLLWQHDWYRNTPIRWVALIETATAFGFGALVCLSLLPAHL